MSYVIFIDYTCIMHWGTTGRITKGEEIRNKSIFPGNTKCMLNDYYASHVAQLVNWYILANAQMLKKTYSDFCISDTDSENYVIIDAHTERNTHKPQFSSLDYQTITNDVIQN